MWLSIIAASVLLALVMAWKSPVKWRLMFSIGTTWEYPPPAAPPLMPITGPREGSRSATMALWPSRANASVSPISTVDFPSPAGVGETPVTNTNLPGSRSGTRVMSTLAMCLP